jgi:hypothetical protein
MTKPQDTSITRLFIVTAVLELGAGLTLLVAPAVVIRLLFGPDAELFPAVGIARLAGAALLSLGAGCWWARHAVRGVASRALIGAMLIYNVAVVALTVVGALGALGVPQWMAVALHTTQAIWCVWIVAGNTTTIAA